jgi:toluene monooxygenase system ferredoxin subunit
MIGIVLEGMRVLLVNDEGTIRAYEDRCAHLGVALSDGALERTTLTCAAHRWQYDVRTGRGIDPACARLRSFPVEVVQGQIRVDLESAFEVGADRA